MRRFVVAGRPVASGLEITWSRPHRRLRPEGLFIPGMRPRPVPPPETHPRLIVALDTSGSIDSTLLEQFMAEVEAIHKAKSNPFQITLIQCDAAVQSVETFQLKPVYQFRGRGGTNFEPVFCYIHHHFPGEKILVIYLTDGCGNMPNRAYACPTLWVLDEERPRFAPPHLLTQKD